MWPTEPGAFSADLRGVHWHARCSWRCMRAVSHLKIAIALLCVGCGGTSTPGTQSGDAGANDATSSCNDNGVTHPSGTTWSCNGGCNSCSCDNGQTSSTLAYCGPFDAGGDGDADSAEATGVDASLEASTCVEAPTLDPSDLTCDIDEDCATVWTGMLCACGCNCPTIAGNTAAYTRVGAVLSAVLQHPATCSEPPCECPALGIPRCFAHQCALCGNAGLVLKNQPAACDQDAAADDGGD